MRFIITGRNIDVTEGLKSAVEEKLGKLDRFFAPETEVNVTLSVEKERQKIEVTIPVKGNIIRSEQVSSDTSIALDANTDVQHRHDDPQLQSRVPHRHRHRTVRWRVGLDHQAHQVIQTGPCRRI